MMISNCKLSGKRVMSFCLVSFLTGTLNAGSSAAMTSKDASRKHCMEGYKLQSRGQSEGAYREYRLALETLTDKYTTPESLDIELNIATALVDCKRFSEAKVLLEKVRPSILPAYKNTLLEARYWRRQLELHKALQQFDQAIAAQDNVITAVGEVLGPDCIDCIDEKLIRVSLLRVCGRWKEGLGALSDCEGAMKNKSRWPQYQECVRCFFLDFPPAFSVILERQGVADAQGLLGLMGTISHSGQQQVSLWQQILNSKKSSANERSVAIDKIISLLVHPEWQRTASESRALAQCLMMRALPGIYEDAPAVLPKNWSGISPESMSDIRLSYEAVDGLARDKAISTNDVLYIQVKSMYSWALCKSGKLAEAAKLLDSVQPTNSAYKDIPPLSGVLQARRALAEAYLKRQDRTLFSQQFNHIYTLIDNVCRGETRKQRLYEWHFQEEKYLDHWSKTAGI